METAGVQDSQPSAYLAGVLKRFLELLPNGLLLMPLSFKAEWKASLVLLFRYRLERSSNCMPRASSLLACGDVRVGFPRALMRVVSLMAFFCTIHSILCNCGDRWRDLIGI